MEFGVGIGIGIVIEIEKGTMSFGHERLLYSDGKDDSDTDIETDTETYTHNIGGSHETQNLYYFCCFLFFLHILLNVR